MTKQTQAVIDAIDDIFGDTSVSQKSTLAEMEEIASDVESKIVAIREDLKRAGISRTNWMAR